MKSKTINNMSILVIALMLAAVISGCGKHSDSEQAGKAGIGERTGIAVDAAASNTVDVAKRTAEAAKDVTGKAIDKTGEMLEKAGAEMEKTGENMQK